MRVTARGIGGVVIVHGDARDVLPTLDLSESVVITDPPWLRGSDVDIIGAGPEAANVCASVMALVGDARAVVVYQSSLDPPLPGPALPFYQTCWMRCIPPGYRGTRIHNTVAYVYGDPPRPRGKRVHAAEACSASRESQQARRDSGHPCPMSLDHARWLVRWFAHGCRVVDPFAGDGTVIAAAAELGMEALGIERDARWIRGARERLAASQRQGLLWPARMEER